jgi:hypothetical protein
MKYIKTPPLLPGEMLGQDIIVIATILDDDLWPHLSLFPPHLLDSSDCRNVPPVDHSSQCAANSCDCTINRINASAGCSSRTVVDSVTNGICAGGAGFSDTLPALIGHEMNCSLRIAFVSRMRSVVEKDGCCS